MAPFIVLAFPSKICNASRSAPASADFRPWTPSWLGSGHQPAHGNLFFSFHPSENIFEAAEDATCHSLPPTLMPHFGLLHSRPNQQRALRGSSHYPASSFPFNLKASTLVDGFLNRGRSPFEGCACCFGAGVSIAIYSRQGNLEDPARLPTSSAAPSTSSARHGDIAWRQQAEHSIIERM